MKITTVALTAALIIMCIMLGNLYTSASDDFNNTANAEPPKYHIQVVTENSNEHFWQMFKQGASIAGENYNVYVEFVNITKRDVDISVQTVERAIWSDVDGIALQAADIKKTTKVLQKAVSEDISVLTYENDIYNIPNVVTIGSNSYDIGYSAGTMGALACNGVGNVVIIINDADDVDNQYKNIKYQGVIDAFSSYPDLKVDEIYTIDTGMFQIEKLTSEILTNNPNVNAIICTDETNTPGVAQVLVDSNRVGDIKVIGYGEMPQTLSYIQRGVIYGTVCPDAYEIGYDVVEQLYSILDGNIASDSTSTNLYSITVENVDEYLTDVNGSDLLG